ncbi:MAG: isoprenylcysteine carboxylmethyltransferase family protein [Bacteroidetes bacterium]|nr:isoprenylcysteine carboxylmethyltransferase family protein [Bacteroidota bacterium]
MFLFYFFILYFVTVFVLKSFRVWTKNKVNPLTITKGKDAHGYNGKVFSCILLIELLVVSIYAFIPNWLVFLLPIWYLEQDTLIYIGWGLIVSSLLFVWLAQFNMKESWRIGIDEVNKTELVTGGLFTFSRNPVFLGIVTTNIGLFLIVPNAISLLILAVTIVTLNTQIRLEEEFLAKEFGSKYSQYKNEVRRWITIKFN